MKHFNLSYRRRRPFRPDRRALMLFVWLMVALMLPNLVLAFTEKYNGWSVAAGITLPLGLYLLSTLATRRTSVIALLLMPIVVLCVVQIVILYLYGKSVVAVDMFTNIMTTNQAESRELLGGLAPIVLVVVLIYLPLIYVAFRQLRRGEYQLSERARRVVALCGAMLTIIGVQLLYPAGEVADCNVVRCEIFPVNALHNLRIAVGNRRAVRNYERTSTEFTYNASRTEKAPMREIYAYVIGESSRAQNWSLYGYGRATNALLAERDDIYLFRNMITQSNTTHKSVPLMLSSVDAEEYDQLFCRKGLAALFGEAGFRTSFISAQSRQGAMVDNFACECDDVLYLDTPGCDLLLLQQMKRIVESTDEDMLIILHCYGSHYRYNQRYPREFAVFCPDVRSDVTAENRNSLLNSYDNSILYTDYLLDSIIEYLGSLEVCAAMLYCADHGEDLFDDNRGLFLHSSPTVSYYQLHIPALAWFSERYRAEHPEKVAMAARHRWSPASTSAMFHTLADIASIRSDYVELDKSLVSVCFEELASRLYLNDRNEAVLPDWRIGITDLDRREFLLHGIGL